jgi:hypothetical protein
MSRRRGWRLCQPTTGELYAAVQERDGLGDNLPPDYLTRVEKGRLLQLALCIYRSKSAARLCTSGTGKRLAVNASLLPAR